MTPATIAPPQDADPIEREVLSLSPDQLLVQHGDYIVCVATAPQIPCSLQEIGRLRETTFRQAGEGTGKSTDPDSFDRHYTHLRDVEPAETGDRGRLSLREPMS